MKLVVRNFQSIKSTVLELTGFSVVTGRSNLGKSALVRALSGAAFGIAGDYFIREGTDRSAVGVKFDDGATLEWYKTRQGKATPGRETSLKVNGVTATKVGREHQKVTEVLGIKEIETQYVRLRPNVAHQQDEIFLIAHNPATVAELLQVLGRIDVVTEAQRRAKQDLRTTQEEKRLRQLDLQKAVDLREEVADVPDLRKRLDVLLKEELRTETEVKLLEGRINQLESWERSKPVQIPDLPKLEPIGAIGLLSSLEGWSERRERPLPELPAVTVPKEPRLLLDLESWIRTDREGRILKEDREETERELDQIKTDRARLEKELGLCPTCGRGF